MSNVPSQLPGDLGEHDPRRMTHPDLNIKGAGGHEVKPNSKEVTGGLADNSEATAAQRDHHDRSGMHPHKDNTAEHAMEGGSTETMDRVKRQDNSNTSRLGDNSQNYTDDTTRAGHQQHHGSHSGSGLTGSHTDSGLTGDQYGSSTTGSGLTGSHTGSGLTGSHTGSSGLTSGTGGLTGSNSGTEPISGLRGSGVGGAPYDGGNIQQSGLSGSAPQHHHTHGHHTTRAGELLDPASGRETGIPGYGQGATEGLTGSHTGSGLTGSNTGSGLNGSHTSSGLTGSNTGSGLTGDQYGSSTTGSGLTGTSTGQHGSGMTGSSHTGEGYTGRDEGLTGREGHSSYDDTADTKANKPSLMDKLNPFKDSDHDGKKGMMD